MIIIQHISLFALAGLLIGCSPKQDHPAFGLAGETKIETTTIKVETIQCNMCVKTIEKTLTTLGGVQTAKVDLDRKTATVEFLPAKATLATIETTITKAGYSANDKKADPEAYEALPGCCKIGE